MIASRHRPSLLDGLASLMIFGATVLLSRAAPAPASDAPSVGPVRPEDLASYNMAPFDADETCAGCRFFCPANSKVGECRRFAPTFEEGMAGEWPLVIGTRWCGEFVPAVTPVLH